MNILITGATGFLGPYLMQEFSGIGTVVGVARSLNDDYQCDLTDPAKVAAMMQKLKPDMVVHAAALTDVEKCQKEPALAVAQNCKATEHVVDLAPDGCRIVYISSDMIYSGPGPHRENTKSENPINMYGMSKYMGEFAARRRENHLIIRTNMVGFSQGKKSSLVDFLVSRFKSGENVSLFTDALFSPLSTKTLSRFLLSMAKTNLTGTYNLGACTGMSKAKFALMLAHELKLPPYGGMPWLSANPERTIRPSDTRMDVALIQGRFGFTLPTLEKEIETMCREHLCVH